MEHGRQWTDGRRCCCHAWRDTCHTPKSMCRKRSRCGMSHRSQPAQLDELGRKWKLRIITWNSSTGPPNAFGRGVGMDVAHQDRGNRPRPPASPNRSRQGSQPLHARSFRITQNHRLDDEHGQVVRPAPNCISDKETMRLICLLAFTLTVACTGKAPEASTGSETPANGPAFVEAVFAAVCTGDASCRRPHFSSPAACKTFLMADKGVPLLEKLKAGTVKYNSGQAAACLASLKVCDGDTQDCDLVVSGAIAVGAPCTLNDCVTGASCRADDKGCAKCVADVALGKPCAKGDTCTANATCDSKGICVADPPGQVGQSCNSHEWCAGNAWCDNSAGVTGTCKMQSDINGPCQGGNSCKVGYCSHKDPDSGVGKCAPDIKVGEKCPGGSDFCEPGSVCRGVSSETETCTPIVQLGGACLDGADCGFNDRVCVNGKCATQPKKGQPCDAAVNFFNACETPYECKGGTCTQPAAPAVGDACTDPGSWYSECGATLFCGKDGKCISPKCG